MRRGRPGLVGTMARTAVIAGTATAVSGNVQRRQYNRAMSKEEEAQAEYDQQQQLAQMQQQVNQVQQQQQAAPAAAPADDLHAQLTKLADLKAAGILTDEEFAAAKAKLL